MPPASLSYPADISAAAIDVPGARHVLEAGEVRWSGRFLFDAERACVFSL